VGITVGSREVPERIGLCLETHVEHFFLWRCGPALAMASSFTRFLDHTQRRTVVGRTYSGRVISSSQRPPPDNINTHNRQTFMPLGGIRTRNPSRRAAADLRLRPRGRWDRHKQSVLFYNMNTIPYQTGYLFNLTAIVCIFFHHFSTSRVGGRWYDKQADRM
jgi:hypothetical protein